MENAKIRKFKCDILSIFQTMCPFGIVWSRRNFHLHFKYTKYFFFPKPTCESPGSIPQSPGDCRSNEIASFARRVNGSPAVIKSRLSNAISAFEASVSEKNVLSEPEIESRVGGEKESFCRRRRKRNSPYALSKQHSSLTKRYVARGERMKREYFPRLPK